MFASCRRPAAAALLRVLLLVLPLLSQLPGRALSACVSINFISPSTVQKALGALV